MSRPDNSGPQFTPPRLPDARPGQRGGKRHANRIRRTHELCTGALDLFLEKGLEPVTIDDIVSSANMSKGSFYRYFSNKAELVETLVEPLADAVTSLLSATATDLERLEDRTDVAVICAQLAEALQGVLTRHAGIVWFYLQERTGVPNDVRRPLTDLSAAVIEHAIRIGHAARAHGLVRPETDARITAITVVGAVQELLLQQLRGRDLGDPASATASLLQVILEGIQRAD